MDDGKGVKTQCWVFDSLQSPDLIKRHRNYGNSLASIGMSCIAEIGFPDPSLMNIRYSREFLDPLSSTV